MRVTRPGCIGGAVRGLTRAAEPSAGGGGPASAADARGRGGLGRGGRAEHGRGRSGLGRRRGWVGRLRPRRRSGAWAREAQPRWAWPGRSGGATRGHGQAAAAELPPRAGTTYNGGGSIGAGSLLAREGS